MYRVEVVVFDEQHDSVPRAASGAFYDVCAGSFEKCMEFIRTNVETPDDCLPSYYRIVRDA